MNMFRYIYIHIHICLLIYLLIYLYGCESNYNIRNRPWGHTQSIPPFHTFVPYLLRDTIHTSVPHLRSIPSFHTSLRTWIQMLLRQFWHWNHLGRAGLATANWLWEWIARPTVGAECQICGWTNSSSWQYENGMLAPPSFQRCRPCLKQLRTTVALPLFHGSFAAAGTKLIEACAWTNRSWSPLAVLRSGEQVENILYIIYCCWVILYATAQVSGLMRRAVVLRSILPSESLIPLLNRLHQEARGYCACLWCLCGS